MSAEIFKLMGTIGVDNKQALKGIDETTTKADGAKGKMGKAFGGIKKAALGIGVGMVAAGGAAVGFAKKAADVGDNVHKASSKLGVSTDAYQELDYWAGQNGMSQADMEKGVGRLNQRMGAALNGNEKYAGTMEKLGINIEDVRDGTVSTEDAFETSITTLQGMENGQEKAALATEMFGTKLAREMLPALEDGSLSIEDAKKKAQDLGIVMSEDSVNAAADFSDMMDDASRAAGAIGVQIGSAVMPMLMSFLEWIMKHMPAIQSVVGKVFGAIGDIVGKAVEVFKTYLIPVFDQLVEVVMENMPMIQSIIMSVLDIVQTVVMGFVRAVGDLWNDWGDVIMVVVKTAFTLIGTIVQTVMKNVQTVIKIVTGLIEGDWQKVWNGIKEYFGTALGAIKKVGTTILNALKQIFGTKLSELKNAAVTKFIELKDGVIEKVIALKDGAIKWITFLKDKAIEIVIMLVTKYVQFWGSLYSKVIKIVIDLKDSAIKWFNILKDKLIDIVKLILKRNIKFWGDLLSKVVQIVVNLKDGVIKWFNIIKDKVIEVVKEILRRNIEFWGNILSKVIKIVVDLKDGVIKWFTFIKDKVVDKVKELYDRVTQWFSELKHNLIRRVVETKDNVINNFNNMKDKTIAKVKELKERVVDWFVDMKDGIADKVTDIIENIKKMPGKMGDGIKKGAHHVKNAFVGMFNSAMKAIGVPINGIIGGANWILEKFDATPIKKWEVPKYARGTGGHPGGMALVNDQKGGNYQEAINLPTGETFIPEGRNLLYPDMPKGTKVLPAKETRKLYKYEKGTGIWAKGKDLAASAKAKLKETGLNVMDHLSKPKELIGKVMDKFLSFGSLAKTPLDMAKGIANKGKDALSGFIKGKFESMMGFGGDGADGGGIGSSMMGGTGFRGFRKTSPFGWRGHPIYGRRKFHSGVDLAAPTGTNVFAQHGGRISHSGPAGTYGNLVKIVAGGLETRYAHLSRAIARIGSIVTQGQLIGKVGSTGNSTGPHLHFEKRLNGRAVHPGYKYGTNNGRKGWNWVGEQGPELMKFEGGEKVKSNPESMRAMDNGDVVGLLTDLLGAVKDGHTITLDGRRVGKSLLKNIDNGLSNKSNEDSIGRGGLAW